MHSFSKYEIAKLGNAIVFLAENIPSLSKTKLLKLIYLLEECSVKMHNVPFFGLKFEVWQAGPVAKEVYIELNESPTILSDFISTTPKTVKGSTAIYINALRKFEDDEFSKKDMDIMKYVVKNFGSKNATELVNITHDKNSLWFKLATENNLIDAFNGKTTNSSSIEIDFTEYLSGCSKEFYNTQIEFNSFSRALI